MAIKVDRKGQRSLRHQRVRKKVSGTPECPRLAVFRSNQHVYAQLIDDLAGKTVAAASSQSKEIKADLKRPGTIEAAKKVGTLIAQRAKAANVKQVVFDRGGYPYHGQVKALAEAAREGGLEF